MLWPLKTSLTNVRMKFLRGTAGGRLAHMATKKKTKKQVKSKRTAGNKVTPTKRQAHRKRKTTRQKSAKEKPAPKKAAVKLKSAVKKTIGGKAVRALKKHARKKGQSVDAIALPPEGRRSRSGGQSGDLQGLSNVESADSESVEELIEEGNAFEADVVTGVEDAGNTDGREVRTHEVPEDDVPDEYLDKE